MYSGEIFHDNELVMLILVLKVMNITAIEKYLTFTIDFLKGKMKRNHN